ncbi:methyltransferase domain-containing protein [Rhodocytophaga rosea]|uniref:Methyltransferase domain-containing protein n=1 Tax=Rhodocytophaga rosea TaxID=2704465 RepID=A0A6C0GQZ7_9BACT|nr:class I SAM-dependent methyltransferase [Rhodocytophaga rosea]QHT70284.1 methyltransferase domain-containing protein [Rhodocytophaga rosea]
MKHLISFVIRHVPRKYLQLVSHVVLKSMAVFYKGNAVECPVCKSQFKKFVPYGRTNPRENALCPNCLALERHRLMWLYLQDKTDFFNAPHKVLHVAPEHCFIHRFEAMKNLDYVTADIESPLAKVKMDIHAIPFEANTFDVAFCNHVMEHVADDHQAMKELYRVLKPNGWAIIQSPMDTSRSTTLEDPSITSEADREKYYWQKDHVRLFGLDYAQRLEKAGFQVTEDSFVKELGQQLVSRYALPGEEIIYFCRKP